MKRKEWMAGVVLTALLAGPVQPQAQSTAEVALRQAMETETIKGDLVFAEEPTRIAEDIIPRAPPEDTQGRIIGIYNGVFLVGQYNVVAINRGERNGLAVGHVLAIDQRGMEIRDWGCYRTRVASCFNRTLLVFKTFDRMSYGLVVNATAEMRVGDWVRSP